MTNEQLQAKWDEYDRKWFNNEPLPEDDGTQIIRMHYGRLDEFNRRFNELIQEFDNKP